MNQTQTEKPEKVEEEAIEITNDEIGTFMENTVYAIETLMEVVRKIKKDHYSSENDEIDADLGIVAETLEAMAEAY